MTVPKHTKILLVEDNRINQAVIMGILAAWRISTDIANNGHEALDILNKSQNSPYHLVLMDCQMPILDGYQTSQTIRSGNFPQIPRDIPIIAMTANTMEGDKEKCLNAGMSDYLSKPVDADMLLEKIQHWLNVARLDREQSSTLNSYFTDELSGDISVQSRGTAAADIPIDAKLVQESQFSAVNNDTWQLDILLKRMRNNKMMVQKLVEMFIEDNAAIKEQFEQAIAKEELSEIKSLAHKIKGSAKNLSLINLGNILQSIELAAKEQRIDNISELYLQFIREYDHLMPLLTQYITNR